MFPTVVPPLIAPKPFKLKLPKGLPRNVERFISVPTPGQKIKLSAAQRSGLRYEARAISYLSKELGVGFPNVWWTFDDDDGRRRCQTDFYHIDPDGELVTIFEMKLGHTADSWWQLRQLYTPVLKEFFLPNVQFNV